MLISRLSLLELSRLGVAILSLVSWPAAGQLPPSESLAKADSNKTATIKVSLALSTGKPLQGQGFVVFQGPASPSPVVVPTSLPEQAVTRLPLDSQWKIIADFPGLFAATSILQIPHDAPPDPIAVQVILRPAGTLTGQFTVEGKENLPTRLEARFEPTRQTPPRKQDVPAGLAACAVGSTGAWRCRLPAGRLDIVLHPEGFVPHYLWNTEVGEGKTIPIGPRRLTRGASVAGWVTREDGTPVEKCSVRLEPLTAAGRPNDPVLDFLRTVANETPCQKKGFFQFAAVPPGSYSIVAQEGEARAQVSPVAVYAGAESRLSLPVVLRRPLDFDLALSPSTDWLGTPWRVEVRRANEYRPGWEEPSFRAEATSEGHLKLPRKLPGRFWIKVFDRLGNAVFSDQHVELSDPSQSYSISIELLSIQGKIHLGDDPVMGRLIFGGRNGTTSVEMTSDREGHFEGPLPRAGRWRIDIEGAEPSLRTAASVEVKPKNGRATVEIELPNTRVYGRVVDSSGNPAPAAEITLNSRVSTLFATSNENGEFDFRAFPQGSAELSARRAAEGKTEVSDTYAFEAPLDSPHGPVVLTLKRTRVVRGKVLGAAGPVIGASVSTWPVQGGDGLISRVRSGLDGSFEFKVPEGTSAVRGILSPPGGALKVFETGLSSGSDLLLQEEPSGGDVAVTFAKGEPADGKILAVLQDGIGIPLGELVDWTEAHGVHFLPQPGKQVLLPRLAPGTYTVCLGTAALVVANEVESWKKQASCASGYLAPGSTLELHIP